MSKNSNSSRTNTGQTCSTTSHTYSSGNILGEKDEERWTTAKIIDELITDLALANAPIVNAEFGHTLIIPKYYDRAAYLMYKIPLYKPKPAFEIELPDLTHKLKRELSRLKLLDQSIFWYVSKMAVTCIFENIDFDYFHRNVMQHLKIRFVEVKGNAENQKIEFES